jgi:2-methylcitrate dehydratase PrpD
MSTLEDRHALAIGTFGTALRLDGMPDDVTHFTRLLLLDTLGALLGGLRYPPVHRLAEHLASAEGPAAEVPFGRLVTLGTAATWLDADSGGSFHPQGHRLPPVPTAHPAPHVLPVLLHAAAEEDVDDQRLLEVFLAATEVGLRHSVASTLRLGLHPHGIHGPGATALATVLLRGGSAEEAAAAFLLGSSLPMAAILAVPMRGGTVRNLWTGLGSYHGALAGRRAAQVGAVSPAAFSALYDGAVATDLAPEDLVGGLGERWEIRNSYLKPYACARWIHPALDATAQAIAGADLAVTDVESVTVETFAFAASLDSLDIRTDMQARFSLPYCLATFLTDGHLAAPSFLPDGLARPGTLELARRVSVREVPEFSAALPRERPTRVTVHGRDGSTWTAEVRNARGNPSDPLSPAEIELKFRRNVGELLPREVVDDAVEGLLQPTPRSGGRALARLSRTLLAGPAWAGD